MHLCYSQGMKREQEWTATGRDAGVSLQDYLAQCMAVSKRVAKQHIDARVVWVNGRCVWMARHELRKGDVIRCAAKVASPTATSKIPRTLPTLFEDADFIVVDKPAGMLADGANGSAEEVLRRQTGNPDVCAVHRLDRDTTGCLLMAKSQRAKAKAVDVFREHRIAKSYRAIVYARWDAKATTLDLPIEGERALTQVTCVRANAVASQLLVRIETGRTHQIRKHLAMARHPVMGDRQYGPKQVEAEFQAVARPMLHAVELVMDHPTREGKLKVFAPIPQDMHRWLNVLKLQS